MHGLSLEDVRTVLAKTNSNTPVGSIAGLLAKQNTTLDASAAIRTADEYRDVIAAYRNGMPMTNDRSVSIRDSVRDVQTTLAIVAVLVVLVIFLTPPLWLRFGRCPRTREALCVSPPSRSSSRS
jgi:multidrug efflux pump subunit AcrB